jgi:hypothetical protein
MWRQVEYDSIRPTTLGRGRPEGLPFFCPNFYDLTLLYNVQIVRWGSDSSRGRKTPKLMLEMFVRNAFWFSNITPNKIKDLRVMLELKVKFSNIIKAL